MHLPINVKSPNNISKRQVEFNSAFKVLKRLEHFVKIAQHSVNFRKHFWFSRQGSQKVYYLKRDRTLYLYTVTCSFLDLLRFRFKPYKLVNTGDMSVYLSTYADGSRIFDMPRYCPLLPFLSHRFLRECTKEERN
jgi:hypothetical protein